MFCRCAFGALVVPNKRTCTICLTHPGTLPVPNKEAIERTIRLALALGCEIAERAVFHRKNYFYPDNPKGYQISQYDEPLCVNGRVRLPGPDGVAEIGITRAHLEEDAAKTLHVGGAEGRIHGATASLVDFNRGGTPLVEIVTEPHIRTADQARRFLQLLRQTVVELRGGLPESPSARLERVLATGLDLRNAEALNLEPARVTLFETIRDAGVESKAAAAFVLNDVAPQGVDPARVDGAELAKVLR